MRLAFLGSPAFALPTLHAVAAAHEVARVYAQPPRPAGRGKALRSCPVQAEAEALGLAVETPERFRDAVEGFAALDLDVAVVVAYGQMLPQTALDAPRFGCLNLHPSALPRWRGAAPIQRAIMAGDRETAACIMGVEAGLDTGPVYACRPEPIGPGDTAGTLHDRLAETGAALMLEVLADLAAGRALARAQAATGATYAEKIEKAEARIDWRQPAEALSWHIRGLSPFPGAWCDVEGERVKVLMAVREAGDGPAGQALDDRLLIACGEGALRLTELQRPGKAPMAAEAFLRGFPLAAGTALD